MGLKYLFPLDADVYNTNTGEKIHGAKTRSGHGLGKLDFGVPDGTPVRAMTNGTVKKAGHDITTSTYTSCDILVEGDYWKGDHDGLVIRYYHINKFPFSVGDHVKQGDVIGYVDGSQADGAHLHLDFCYMKNGAYGKDTLLEARGNWDSWSDEQRAAIKIWSNQLGSNSVGRCWEVIATPATYLEPSATTSNLKYPSGLESIGGTIANQIMINLKKVLPNITDYTPIVAGIMGNLYTESGLNPRAKNSLGYCGLYQTNDQVFITKIFNNTAYQTDEQLAIATIDYLFGEGELNCVSIPKWKSLYLEYAQKKGLDSGKGEAIYQCELFQVVVERGVGNSSYPGQSLETSGAIEVCKKMYGGSKVYTYQGMNKRRDSTKKFLNGGW